MVLTILKKSGSSLRDALNLVEVRAARYQQVGLWIIKDSFWRYRWRVATMLLLSGIALALQAGALGLFLQYARSLESGSDFAIAGYTLGSGVSRIVLLGAIGIGGIMFIMSSFLRLYSVTGFYDIGRRYALLCAERLITETSASLYRMSATERTINLNEFRLLVIGGSDRCSRVLIGLLGICPMLAGFIVFSGFLFYLDIYLSVIVFGVISLSFIAYYALSVHAATLLRIRMEKKRAMSADFKSLVDIIKNAVRPLPAGHPLIDRTISGSFEAFYSEFLRGRLLNARSLHVSTIVQAIILVIIGLVKGDEIITTRTGLGDLVIFLITGRIAITNILGVTSSLVMINRFYPVVSEYVAVVDRLNVLDPTQQLSEVPLIKPPFVLTAQLLAGRAPKQRPQLRAGTRLAIVTPKPIDRFDLPEILSWLSVAGGRQHGTLMPSGRCWLVPEKKPQAAMDFNEMTGWPQGTDAGFLRRELASLGLEDEDLSTLPDDPCSIMTQNDWSALSEPAFLGAHLLAAGRTDYPVLVMSAEATELAGKKMAQRSLAKLLRDKIVLVGYRPKNAMKIGALRERYALLYDGETLLGYVTPNTLKANVELLELLEEKHADADAGDDMDMDEM